MFHAGFYLSSKAPYGYRKIQVKDGVKERTKLEIEPSQSQVVISIFNDLLSGKGLNKCVLKYIPYDERVEIGDIVITSGLDSLFPKGILIGYISKVNKEDTSLFQHIEVVPFKDTAKIEEVVIIQRE